MANQEHPVVRILKDDHDVMIGAEKAMPPVLLYCSMGFMFQKLLRPEGVEREWLASVGGVEKIHQHLDASPDMSVPKSNGRCMVWHKRAMPFSRSAHSLWNAACRLGLSFLDHLQLIWYSFMKLAPGWQST